MPAHATDTVKKFTDLPKRKRDFVKEYIRSGDAHASFLKAGYKDGRASMKNTSRLLREMAPYLQTQMTEYLEGVEMAILGTSVIAGLARDSENDAVKLNAAKELLSRAAPENRETTVNHVHKNMTDAAIDKRLEQLQNKLFIDAPAVEVLRVVK